MFSSTLISLISIAVAAPAAGESFQLATVHSGSQFQYSPVKLDSKDGSWSLNGDQELTIQFQEDGSVLANGDHVDLERGFPIANKNTWSTFNPKIDENHLSLDDSTSFYVCPEANNKIALGKYGVPGGCANPVGVVLLASKQ